MLRREGLEPSLWGSHIPSVLPRGPTSHEYPCSKSDTQRCGSGPAAPAAWAFGAILATTSAKERVRAGRCHYRQLRGSHSPVCRRRRTAKPEDLSTRTDVGCANGNEGSDVPGNRPGSVERRSNRLEHPYLASLGSRADSSVRLKSAKSPTLTWVAFMPLLVATAGGSDEPTGSAKSGHKDAGSASGAPSSRASSDTAINAAKPDPLRPCARPVGRSRIGWLVTTGSPSGSSL